MSTDEKLDNINSQQSDKRKDEVYLLTGNVRNSK